ncbi:hypothetical protein FH972_019596 [Carpinus fangiana]|uniref:Uncharacterized protein n=1 Tax=Carpinus fangiana TaxID=176857 RepID=A0A5N6RSU2_9ROSI|nr:hypothetical protein FH972_019596 [Carpinus fangiana]
MRSKASLAFFLAKEASFTWRSVSTLAAAAALWMDMAAIRATGKSALAKSRSMARLGLGSKKEKLGLEQGGQRKEGDETAQERWAMEEQWRQMRRSDGNKWEKGIVSVPICLCEKTIPLWVFQ